MATVDASKKVGVGLGDVFGRDAVTDAAGFAGFALAGLLPGVSHALTVPARVASARRCFRRVRASNSVACGFSRKDVVALESCPAFERLGLHRAVQISSMI